MQKTTKYGAVRFLTGNPPEFVVFRHNGTILAQKSGMRKILWRRIPNLDPDKLRQRTKILKIENDKPSVEDGKWLDDMCTKTKGQMRKYSQKTAGDWASA